MKLLLPLLAALLLSACAASPKSKAYFARQQVVEIETAFAQSMAERDHARFASFIAEDAVFLNGDEPLRGKPRVVEFWKQYFVKPEAPFHWKPEQVEIALSGTLAYSSGPVFTADGTVISRFHSIWRLEAPGEWKVVFDQGTEVCDCLRRTETTPVAAPVLGTPMAIPAEPSSEPMP